MTLIYSRVAGTGGDALTANPLSQFAATTSVQLAGVISDETGSGALVFASSPTLVTPALGTPASGVLTNCTGTASGLTAGNVTTNANLTGHVTSTGNAAVLGSFTKAQLDAALSDAVGTYTIGTPVDGQVGVWTGAGTLEGDTGLAFDTAGGVGNELTIGGDGALNMAADRVLQSASGTVTLSNINAIDATTEATIEAAIDTLSNLTTVGTITTGTWTGTTIAVANGGTGLTSLGTGLQALRTNAGATAMEWFTLSGGGDALTADPLSQFALTTSAQLAGVMSDETGSGLLVFGTSPTLITPALGTPASGVLTNCTGTAAGLTAGTVSTITGLAPDTATTAAAQPNVTSLGTLTVLNVDDVSIDGNTISSSGASTLAITPTAGQSITFDGTVTLDAGVIAGATSITSTAFIGDLTGNADTVTTNANLTGHVTSTGSNATVLGSFTSAELLAALTDETGTGAAVFATSPVLVTPALGTPASGVATNLTGTAAGLTAGAVSTITGLAPDTATTAAAQPNITSLGTLTTLTVDDVTLNGNTISSGGASTLAINPTAGQAITFDGTITLDAGVIAGATSITSTTFVGSLTGNADTVTDNANLTGPITSVGNATTVDPTAISGQALVTAVATDMLLLWDATDSGIKRCDVNDLLAGAGDMVLASAQTNAGIKTFLDTTMKLRNVANTFDGYFVNTNTADRIYTLQDAAGTLAFTSDITGTNSGTNTGDQTSIVGITGTKAEFDTAVTDGSIMYVGDAPTAHTHTAADITDLTATVAELNVLDLSATALTAGWVYSADGASTASWRKLLGSELTNDSGWIASITGLAPDTATTAAAQPNITSLGTLTTLTVDDITVNGNTISSTGASTLAITPTAGQSITFDGTITLDAGVIAGATSITSTSFMAGAGDASNPAITFSTDPDTGLYSFINTMRTTVGGVATTSFSATGIHNFVAGTSSAPSLTFNDVGTGLYRSALDEVSIASNQTAILTVGTGVDILGTADLALNGGNITLTGSGTVDGRDVAADGTKLDGIEALADVTDAANVTAAGALMDSEVDADLKTLALPANTTISAFGATLVDDADAAAARTTLGITNVKQIDLYVIEFDTPLSTGDGKMYFRIPPEMNGMELVTAGAQLGSTKSASGGPVTIQISKGSYTGVGGARTWEDMLVTNLLKIDDGEWDSKDAAAITLQTDGKEDVATGDLIRIDVDDEGSGAKGLFVTLGFS